MTGETGSAYFPGFADAYAAGGGGAAGLAAMAAASTAMVVTFAWKLAIRPVVQEVQALLKSLVDMVELAPVDMFVY